MYSNLDKTKIGAGLSDLDELARQKAYIEEVKDLVAKIAGEKGSPLTCHVATFGCQMNARDSEKLLGILIEAGYQPIETEDADLVVYNTCTVRDNANQNNCCKYNYKADDAKCLDDKADYRLYRSDDGFTGLFAPFNTFLSCLFGCFRCFLLCFTLEPCPTILCHFLRCSCLSCF